MVLGRPTNLVLGAATAIFSLVVIVLAALVPPIVIPAVVVGAVNLAFGAVIALIANQPPTLSPGDSFNVKTPTGQPDYQTTVATPPKADPAPKPVTDVKK